MGQTETGWGGQRQGVQGVASEARSLPGPDGATWWVTRAGTVGWCGRDRGGVASTLTVLSVHLARKGLCQVQANGLPPAGARPGTSVGKAALLSPFLVMPQMYLSCC